MKYALISGSSGGMGSATAKKLISQGYFVYGLDINKPNYSDNNFKYIETDLRDELAVKKAHEIISSETKELDLIINMAGINDINSLIEMSEEDFVDIFNRNVFSNYRVNKMFAPLLKEGGKIIIVTSELGPLDPLPFIGIYGITKAALEKYAYSLRMELQLLNKQVVVIRPGAVNTPMLEVAPRRIEDLKENTKYYKTNASKFQKITSSVESKNIPPEKIANLVSKISKKKKPKYVYKINRNPDLILLNALPQKTQNYIIKKILLSKEKSSN